MRTQEQVLTIAGLLAARFIGSGPTLDSDWDLARGLVDSVKELPAGVGVVEVSTSEGYAEWAERYDDPKNPFFSLQERHLFPRLRRGPTTGLVLDVAGGTGRIGALFVDRKSTVIVIDRSFEMLREATNKGGPLLLVQGDFEKLPVANSSVNHLLCSLALTHTRFLDKAVAEFARVTTDHGVITICDIHPIAVMLGWQAFFEQRSGSRAFVRNHVHMFSRYLSAFRSSSLSVDDLTEINFDETSLQSLDVDEADAAGVVRAYVGRPALVVWTLRRL